MIVWILVFIGLVAAVFLLPKDRLGPVASENALPTPTASSVKIIAPLAPWRSRVTKKSFGTYVNPRSSPVSPERFTGYHTGIDIEYPDITDDVAVVAIADGEIITSRFASGYGGVVMAKHLINGQTYYAVYGHLRINDMVPEGVAVRQGQTVGFLGDAYSRDTDNERRHLHFGLGLTDSLLGYVQNESELSGWIDPLTIIP